MGQLKETYWPDTSIRENAEKAVENAATVAFAVAGGTALFSLLALFHVTQLLSPWSLVDAALFLIAGLFIRGKSKTAAVVGLLLYLSEVVNRILTAGGSIGAFSALMIIFTLYFINGVRGASALARMPKDPTDAVST